MVNWSISTANLERPSNSMAKAANVVEVPSVVKLTGMKALTIAAWVKPNEIIRCHRNIDNLPETNWGVYRLLKRPIHEYTRSGVDDGVAAHLRGRVRALAYGCQRSVLRITPHDIRKRSRGNRSYLPSSEHHWQLLLMERITGVSG